VKPALLRFLWFAGGLALLLGISRQTMVELMPRPRELPRLDGATGKRWVDEQFVGRETSQQIEAGLLPEHIQRVSSWVGSDEWQGRAETAWFKASRRLVHVGVAGYPQHRGCTLWAEFRTATGETTHINCPLINPRERWNVWEIRRPAGAVAVRLIAEDRASDNAGWVAFSHPFRAWPGVITAGYQLLQLCATTALALVLIWGPGLLWFCANNGRTRETLAAANHVAKPVEREANAHPVFTHDAVRLVFLLGGGPLILAAIGIVIWSLSGVVRPQTVGLVLITILWSALGVTARRRRFVLDINQSFSRILGVSALLVIAVVAKSSYSVGPQGELFQGTVSRNMEMADRIDSRYSFYVVQAATHHFGPAAPATEKFFHPWTFFSRGPLAGLAALPVVMATNGHPLTTLPENRWSPFDPTGFAAYRVTMIVLASMVIVAVFVMLTQLVGERWAFVAAGLLALAPFGAHEMMFTWPKWTATAWLAASLSLAHARRPIGAGVALGVGFLFHPLALLWAPWIALWAAGRNCSIGRHDVSRGQTGTAPGAEAAGTPALRSSPLLRYDGLAVFAGTVTRFAIGAAACVVPWMVLGSLMPHLPTTPLAGQGGFFRYWIRADWKPATWDTWWRTRWMNFANTFVPLHVYLAEASFNHPKLSSAYETSGRLVKFSQVWWNSLPFAMGLGLWATSLVALARTVVEGLWISRPAQSGNLVRGRESGASAVASDRQPAERRRTTDRDLLLAIFLFVVGPALLITAYWGMDPLGLMRECGHPLFVAIIAITCAVAARSEGALKNVLLNPAVPWLQLPETLLMLWLTALCNPAPWAVEYDQLDWVYFALSLLALAAAAWVVSRGRSTQRS
jgi:hypothetical protein